MSYEKQTWVNGEVITDTKLNHMEDGIASGSNLLVTYTANEEEGYGILDKTWNEIKNAFPNVYVYEDNPPIKTYYQVGNIYDDNGTSYGVRFGDGSFHLATDSPDGYPRTSLD